MGRRCTVCDHPDRDAIDQAYFLPADGTISTLPGTMQTPVEATV